MKRVNHIAAALESSESLRAATLQDSLHSSGSTWARWDGTIPDSDSAYVVRAVDAQGGRWISHRDIGLAEYLCAQWISRRRVLPVRVVPMSMSSLSAEQSTAVSLLAINPVSVMSGLPGTGKTYSMRVAYEGWITAGLQVALCAFTGAASSRLGESVGGQGSTIHRLLGYSWGAFLHDSTHLLDIDVCVIDESGMLSPVLLWCLLRALPDRCQVVMVGDPYQLPSVEPGYILGDLCEVLPHARLTEIRRSDPDGPIGLAAAEILAGRVPANGESGGSGFYQVAHDSDIGLLQKCARVHKRLATLHNCDITAIRVMGPTNLIVDKYNAYCNVAYAGPTPYMAIKNNADIGYYNGDRGVREGNYIRFENGIIAPLVESTHRLGFASTVWKMQGREADACILLIPHKGCGYPRRAEIYTAVTRARSRVAVVGNLSYFHRAIVAPSQRRQTLLREFLSGTAKLIEELTT